MNEQLFLLINAAPGLSSAQLLFAVFIAKGLVYLAPLMLLGVWLTGNEAGRREVLQVIYAVVVALACAWLIRYFFPHPRPFMIGLGQQYLEHEPTSSFPSNHATFLFTVAVACLAGRRLRVLGGWFLLFAFLVGWSRIFLGVHFPFDISGGLILALVSVSIVRLAYRWSDSILSTAVLHAYDRIFARFGK